LTLKTRIKKSNLGMKKDKSGRCGQVIISFGLDLDGHWSLMTGGCCSKVAISTGLTVLKQ